MRCSDCFFLYNKLPGGRDPKSCSELGEVPQGRVCQNFRPRGSNPNLPLAPTEVQLDPDKPIDFEYAKAFRQLLGEEMQIIRDLDHVKNEIAKDLFLNQAPTEFEAKTFTAYVEKLVDLRTLHLLCGLFECGIYRDVIMAAEVERLFGVKPDNKTLESIQKATKELAYHARLLRVPNDADRTSVGRTRSGRAEHKAAPEPVQAVDPAARAAQKSRRRG